MTLKGLRRPAYFLPPFFAAQYAFNLADNFALVAGLTVFFLAFAASGSLFAWNSWKLPVALLGPGDYETPEYPAVALIEYVLGIGAGVILLTALLRAERAVRRTH